MSSLVAGFAGSFSVYLISAVLWGFFYTTQNGAYESTLYDTLAEESRAEDYARYSGYSNAAMWLSVFVASIIGAYVGSRYGLRTAFYATLIPNALNILLACTLHEPTRKNKSTHSSGTLVKKSLRFLTGSAELLKNSAIYMLLAVIGWLCNEFSPLFFIDLVFSVFVIGFIGASSGMAQAIGNIIGHKFTHVSSLKVVSVILTLYIVTFTLPSNYRFLSVVMFLLLVLTRNVFYIVNNSDLQHKLPTEFRATAISTLGMVTDALLVLSFLTFGFVSRHHNIRTSFLAALAYAVLPVTLLVGYRILSKNNASKAKVYDATGPSIDIDSIPR